jgi:hypothetical protein
MLSQQVCFRVAHNGADFLVHGLQAAVQVDPHHADCRLVKGGLQPRFAILQSLHSPLAIANVVITAQDTDDLALSVGEGHFTGLLPALFPGSDIHLFFVVQLAAGTGEDLLIFFSIEVGSFSVEEIEVHFAWDIGWRELIVIGKGQIAA